MSRSSGRSATDVVGVEGLVVDAGFGAEHGAGDLGDHLLACALVSADVLRQCSSAKCLTDTVSADSRKLLRAVSDSGLPVGS